MLLAGWVVASSASAQGQAPGQGTPSLYTRLGGYDAIAAVVDDFVPRLVADPLLAKYFVGASNDSKMRIRQLVVDKICQMAGGPCLYIGKDLKAAHAGLGITEAEWNAAVKGVTATLDKFKVMGKEREELLAAVASLKGEVVEKK
jgi:hemoglobin